MPKKQINFKAQKLFLDISNMIDAAENQEGMSFEDCLALNNMLLKNIKIRIVDFKSLIENGFHN